MSLGGMVGRAGSIGRLAAPHLDMVQMLGPTRWWSQRREARRRAAASADDPEVYRPIWQDAALAVGADLHDLGSGYLELRRDGVSTVVWRNLVQLDDPVTLRIAGDRLITHRLLSDAGIPVSDHLAIDRRRPSDARAWLTRSGQPCVVKPSFGTGGAMGITCGVRTWPDLARAVVQAGRWDDSVLIERQAEGCEYRILLLDGVPLDVVRRRRPHVSGDGRSTVEELIAAENRTRQEARGRLGIWPITIDLDCVLTLRAAGLDLGSVAGAGRDVVVKGAANQNSPKDNETVRHQVGPALLADATAAVRALGVRLGSVELITTDPALSLREAGGVVLEINTTPGLHYHYQVANTPEAVHVAVPLLQTLLRRSGPVPAVEYPD